jgi:hypothetical protein
VNSRVREHLHLPPLGCEASEIDKDNAWKAGSQV